VTAAVDTASRAIAGAEVRLDRLWLHDFRSWETAALEPAPGLTVLVGPNGAGKTNILEAIGYLASRRSLRGAAGPAMIRSGATSAVVRAEARRGSRSLLLEAEIQTSGRDRFQLNRQPVRQRSTLAEGLVVSVFTPDDLELVKAGPAGRRDWLDGILAASGPAGAGLVSDVDRILRQRSGLLRQVAPTTSARLDPSARTTLEVWDEQLVTKGEALGRARADLLASLHPALIEAHTALTAGGAGASVAYEPPWLTGGLAASLESVRADELRRGQTLVGPHRDEIELTLDGRPARTHASQGEQRTLALTLRLAAHRHLTQILGAAPLLLLDDVFSELDAARSAALVAHLPAGQALLTTAAEVPAGTQPERVVRVARGELG
jgi:DNA replication and repair protein RecF